MALDLPGEVKCFDATSYVRALQREQISMQLENSSNKTRQEPICASTKMVEHAEMWSQTEERSRAKRLLWFNLRKKNSKK